MFTASLLLQHHLWQSTNTTLLLKMNKHSACKDYLQVWRYRQCKCDFDELGVVAVHGLFFIISLNVFHFSKLGMCMAV